MVPHGQRWFKMVQYAFIQPFLVTMYIQLFDYSTLFFTSIFDGRVLFLLVPCNSSCVLVGRLHKKKWWNLDVVGNKVTTILQINQGGWAVWLDSSSMNKSKTKASCCERKTIVRPAFYCNPSHRIGPPFSGGVWLCLPAHLCTALY